MRIDVIRTVLRIVFENEECCVVPIRRVRNRLDRAADSEIVIGNGRARSRSARPRAGCVIIRQANQDVVRHSVMARSTVLLPLLEGTQKYLDANLIRHTKIKVRRLRREVAYQFGLGSNVRREPWNGPGPEILSASPLHGQRLSRLDV